MQRTMIDFTPLSGHIGDTITIYAYFTDYEPAYVYEPPTARIGDVALADLVVTLNSEDYTFTIVATIPVGAITGLIHVTNEYDSTSDSAEQFVIIPLDARCPDPIQAASLHQLAVRAQYLYVFDNLMVGQYDAWALDAWRKFVHEVGSFYHQSAELPFPDLSSMIGGASPSFWRQGSLVPLPYDVRRLDDGGVRIGYSRKAVTISDNGDSFNITCNTAWQKLHLQGGITQFKLILPSGSPLVGLNGYELCSTTSSTMIGGFDVVSNIAFPTGFVNPGFADESVYLTETSSRTCALIQVDEVEVTYNWTGALGIDSYCNTTTGYPSIRGYNVSTPTAYTLVGNSLLLNRVNDGRAITLTVDYDGEVPANFDILAPLPIAPFIEQGIIGYILYMAARYKGDDRLAKIGLMDYSEAISIAFSADILRRMGG